MIGQISRDVIGRLSVKPRCHWLWRLWTVIGAFLSSFMRHFFRIVNWSCKLKIRCIWSSFKWFSITGYLCSAMRGYSTYRYPSPNSPNLLVETKSIGTTVCDKIPWNSTQIYRSEPFAAHSPLKLLFRSFWAHLAKQHCGRARYCKVFQFNNFVRSCSNLKVTVVGSNPAKEHSDIFRVSPSNHRSINLLI